MADLQYDNRQVLPRWFLYHAFRSMSVGYRTKRRDANQPELDQLATAVANWKNNKTLSFAIELLAATEVGGESGGADAKEAMALIQSTRNTEASNPLLYRLLSLIEGDFGDTDKERCADPIDVTTEAARTQISEAKKRLVFHPNDAITWIDLAYLYTIKGLPAKARRCVEVASSLSSGNPNIIRFSSRFYIHVDEPDRALALIRASPSILSDPLLLASEIAISEAFGLKSKFISNGKRIIDAAMHSNHDLTELYAALSTIEFWAGQ